MAKKGTRKNSGKKGIFGKVWAIPGHALGATGNTIGEVAGVAGNVVKRGVTGAKRLGNIWTSHANMAIKNIVSRKGRRNGRRNATRRHRR